jgi:hypothetical protein
MYVCDRDYVEEDDEEDLDQVSVVELVTVFLSSIS